MSIENGRFYGRKQMKLIAHITDTEGKSLTPFLDIGLIQCGKVGCELVIGKICQLEKRSSEVDYLLELIDKYLISEGADDKHELMKEIRALML